MEDQFKSLSTQRLLDLVTHSCTMWSLTIFDTLEIVWYLLRN